MIRITRFVALAALVFTPGWGWSQPAMTAQQAEEILKELRAIRQAIERLQLQAPAPSRPGAADAPRVTLPEPAGHMLGRPDAPVTIVEFTDLQCPFCSRFAAMTFPELKRRFIETGQVRFFSRDLPLEQLHPLAMRAALVSRCAGEQGRFWEVREQIVRNAERLTAAFLDQVARSGGLDAGRLGECLSGNRHRPDIDADVRLALSLGITGTPTFVIGRTAPGAFEGVRVVGAQPIEVFDAQIRALLGAP